MTDEAPARRLVLVTGHPASGKSTLARRLADALSWPLIEKDAIKERLFETVPESSTALGPATWEIFYYMLDVVMATGRPVLAEGNFWPMARARLQAIVDRHGYYVVEIVLEAPLDVLRARYLARLGDTRRHRAHTRGIGDPVGYIERTLREPYQAMGLGERVVHIDTGDWSRVDIPALLRLATES